MQRTAKQGIGTGVLPLLLALLFSLPACTPAPEKVVLAGQTMGTYWRVSLLAEGASEAERAGLKDTLEAALASVNASMSTWDPKATISRFNASETLEPFPIEPAFAQVVVAAQAVSAASGGALDVTVGPLVDLWGFGAGGARRAAPPAPEAITEAQLRVGYEKLAVSETPPTLQRLAPGVEVDLSALAKGYGVDVLVERLNAAGFQHFLVDIGGEVR
ncbi:MAG: FAD:protein FMN transferase, partial [Pseudomonadales bacterium]|nr:FAD:protein FMN transferase [Pseudomonadales bacterium]